jgi:hypothetical protein
MTSTALHEIYRTHMMDAKIRIVAAEKVLSNKGCHGIPALDHEFCFLQIRRIVEDITFSAMVRESARYTKLRKIQSQENPRDHGLASKDWQAPEILKRLVSLSPYALPIPIIREKRSSEGNIHFDRKCVEVNHGRLIELYKQSGGFLHAKNPLSGDFVNVTAEEREKYARAPIAINQALNFLREMLWEHGALQLEWQNSEDPLSIENASGAWLVFFGENQGPDVQIILAEARGYA